MAQFLEGTLIKAWGQCSYEEEGSGKWEEVSAAIKFVTDDNVDGGGGGPVEGRES